MGKPFVGNYPITCGKYYSSGAPHIAIDYGCPIGTEVLSVGDGTVGAISDGVSNNKPGVNPGPNSPSNWVMIYTTFQGKPAYVYYQHLSPGLKVSKGQKVTNGQLLAKSGNSGNTTGPHLHVATGWGHPSPVNRYQYMTNEFMIYPPTQLYLPEGTESDVPDYMSVSKSTDFDLKVADGWRTLYFDKESSDEDDQHADGNYPTILTDPCNFIADFNISISHVVSAVAPGDVAVLIRFAKYIDKDKTIVPYPYQKIPLLGKRTDQLMSMNGIMADGQRLRIQAMLQVPTNSPITFVSLIDYDCRLTYWMTK